VLKNLWLFLFAAQPKAFFFNGLKKSEQGSHKCVELRGECVEEIHVFNPVACFLHKAKDLSVLPSYLPTFFRNVGKCIPGDKSLHSNGHGNIKTDTDRFLLCVRQKMIRLDVIYASNGDIYLYHSPGSPGNRVTGSSILLIFVRSVNLMIIEQNLWAKPDVWTERLRIPGSLDADRDVAGVT
jgi:hypothetical protein